MRLDKFLAHGGAGSRSEVKEAVKKGLVLVNGIRVKDASQQIDPEDTVTFKGQVLSDCMGPRYYMMHKPAGVLTATQDKYEKTVMDLIEGISPKGLFPVGRLDKDTEGLLLLTDDGALAHELLSPRKHVEKTYQVLTEKPLAPEDISRLQAGIHIGDEKPTLPAKVECRTPQDILLTIQEGRYHQIKRMLQAVGNNVLYLKRLSMGGLTLDPSLPKGACRPLRKEEIELLKQANGKKQHPLKKKLSEFQGILFDLDGTLVDSMWMWRQIDIEYLSRFGIPLPEDLQKEIEGMSFSETACYFKQRFALPDEVETIKQDWNAMTAYKYGHEVFYKAGAEEFLRLCRKKSLKLGVATSNSRELADIAARALSLHDYMDCILTACEVNRGKPAPDVYLEAARRLGVPPDKCLVFEDIPAGIQAGKAAGMQVCAVEDAYSKNIREEKMAMADYYIESFTELLSDTGHSDTEQC